MELLQTPYIYFSKPHLASFRYCLLINSINTNILNITALAKFNITTVETEKIVSKALDTSIEIREAILPKLDFREVSEEILSIETASEKRTLLK